MIYSPLAKGGRGLFDNLGYVLDSYHSLRGPLIKLWKVLRRCEKRVTNDEYRVANTKFNSVIISIIPRQIREVYYGKKTDYT
jgi:hypothetical protein